MHALYPYQFYSLLNRFDDEGARDALVSPSETVPSISPRTESVYMPTTVPINSSSAPKNSQRGSVTSSLTTNSGDFNELGIPSTATQPVVTSPQRWLPRQQRELLQKQAEMFVKSSTRKETDIF